jgi:CubicO group peptidase (beta-lactamase class C family)
MKKLYSIPLFLTLSFFFVFNFLIIAINTNTDTEIAVSGNNWEKSNPEEQGMNPQFLTELKEYIEANYPGMYSLLIIRNGFLVEEEYFAFTADTKREIYSCTKSFISALIGIAIQEGFIDNVDSPVFDFFPDRLFANFDERKQNMTLYHLLTMTTGLEWYELQVGYDNSNNSIYLMLKTDDWIKYVLDQKMIEEPGKKFNYHTGASHVMSAIINKTTGLSTLEFAKTRLFEPLGIEDYGWSTDPDGVHIGGYGLELTPRSLAKLGQLYLNNGSWKGEQIVPEEWILTSTRDHRPPGNYSYGYGFQWWIHPDNGIFSAWGHAEQRVIVVPKYQLVAVFTGYMPDIYGDPAGDLVDTFVIPAITEFTQISTSTITEFTQTSSSSDHNSSSDNRTIFFIFTIPYLCLIVITRRLRSKEEIPRSS